MTFEYPKVKVVIHDSIHDIDCDTFTAESFPADGKEYEFKGYAEEPICFRAWEANSRKRVGDPENDEDYVEWIVVAYYWPNEAPEDWIFIRPGDWIG